MNSFAYLFHQFAARTGLVSARSYLRNATEEAILLGEAEVLLGKLGWQDVEHVDEISSEYWSLRELQREQDEYVEQLEEAKTAQEQLMSDVNEAPPEMLDRVTKLEEEASTNRTAYLQSLAEMQEKVNQSNRCYKRFNGLKLKLNVLKNEGADEEQLSEIRDQLRATRDDYTQMARVIAKHKAHTRELEERGTTLQQEVAQAREEINSHHRARTRSIADTSKVIVEYSSKVEQLEKKKRELQKEIGKFLCRECGKMDELSEVSKKFSPLLNRTRSLVESIRLNYRLADFK